MAKFRLGQHFLNYTRWQVISYLVMTSKKYVDYLDQLDYDAFDWQEWDNIHRN